MVVGAPPEPGAARDHVPGRHPGGRARARARRAGAPARGWPAATRGRSCLATSSGRRSGAAGGAARRAAAAVLLSALAVLVAGGTLGRRSRARPCPRRAWRADLRLVVVLRDAGPRPEAPDGIVARARALPGGGGGSVRGRPPSRWPSSGGSSVRAGTGSTASRRTRCPPGSRSPRRRRSAPSELQTLVEALDRLPGVTEVQAAFGWVEPSSGSGAGFAWAASAWAAVLGLAAFGAAAGATRAARRAGAAEVGILRLAGVPAFRLAAPPLLQGVCSGGARVAARARAPAPRVRARRALDRRAGSERSWGSIPFRSSRVLAGDPDRRRGGARAGRRPRGRPRLIGAGVMRVRPARPAASPARARARPRPPRPERARRSAADRPAEPQGQTGGARRGAPPARRGPRARLGGAAARDLAPRGARGHRSVPRPEARRAPAARSPHRPGRGRARRPRRPTGSRGRGPREPAGRALGAARHARPARGGARGAALGRRGGDARAPARGRRPGRNRAR